MSNKTVKELKSTAKELGLKGYSKLKRFELIKMIEDYKHNESANKLRSFSKEFGARHRDFIKKRETLLIFWMRQYLKLILQLLNRTSIIFWMPQYLKLMFRS